MFKNQKYLCRDGHITMSDIKESVVFFNLMSIKKNAYYKTVKSCVYINRKVYQYFNSKVYHLN